MHVHPPGIITVRQPDRGAEIRQDLPQEPNSFVGRERELDELGALLRSTRMLTLTGPGGIGKTRLGLRLLASIGPDLPDGACFVELADITSPDLVVPRVASVLGVAAEQDRALLDTLADALRPRALLLGLDNCEHLIDACAELCHRLLASVPGLRLLATSREPLRVAGETVWTVPPLPVRPAAPGSQLPSDAVQLFAERAAAAVPGFILTPATADVVTEICRSLDGMPLAIELAAARVRALSVEQIRMRMADRLRLLTTGDRAGPARQRTLRAAIDWSYDLLVEPERALLRRLSVFAGWSHEMSELICADDLVPAGAMLDTAAALVDKSLVIREPEALGQARFRMLDTIREYAAEKLAESGEGPEITRQFRDYVLTVAERNFAVGMALIPAPWQDRIDVFRRYDVDATNVWLVLADCLADGDIATGLRICTAVRPCILVRGEYALGSEWLDAFLAADEAAEVDPRIRGAALIGRAQLTLASDPAGAEPLARAGLKLSREADDGFWTAAGLNLLSEIAVHTGRPDEAEEHGREAMARAEATGDGWNKGWALAVRAAVAGVRGQLDEAAALASASIGVMRAIDHRWGMARAQMGLGDLARIRGRRAEAQHLYTEALAYLREIGDRPEVARCLSGLGRVALDMGDVVIARERLTESLRMSQAIGTRIGISRGLESFAALAVRENDPRQAVLLAAAASALREKAGLPPLAGARAERYLAPAHGLGEQVVAALWAEGLDMPSYAAIELALKPPTTAENVRADGDPLRAGEATPAAPSPLTSREMEIAALVAEGRSNRAIADELVISPATAARHIANIMIKLGFHSRAQIATWHTSRRLRVLIRRASLLDRQLGGRVGLQTLLRDRPTAQHRPAIAARLEPGKRPVNGR